LVNTLSRTGIETRPPQPRDAHGGVLVVDRSWRLGSVLSEVVRDVTGRAAWVRADGNSAIVAARDLDGVRLLIIEVERYLPEAVEAIRYWREHRPECAIIAMSYGDNASLAASLGCTAYLERPFRFEHFLDLLRTHLDDAGSPPLGGAA
jgi:DNA-binding NtrC family response regulator